MSSKKKRNKQYKGATSNVAPTIVKVSAVKRHPLHQWWLDHKRLAKPVFIVTTIVAVIALVVVGIVSVIF